MARRIAASSVQWSALAERVPPAQKTNYLSFKTKSDGYLRRVLANPADLPKIDWNTYKSKVPIPGMVDAFQKQYEALKIPYPADTLTSKVEEQGSKVKDQIAKFVSDSNARIAEHQKELATLAAMLPYTEMTVEDFFEAHPEVALDPEKPSFWPHGPEDFPDHEGANVKEEEHH